MTRTRTRARTVAPPEPSKPDRCRAIKKDGTQCQIKYGLDDEGLCLWHSEKNKAKAKRARRKGGRTAGQRSRDVTVVPPTIETLDDCVRWSAWVAQAVATGAIDPKRAMEVTRAIGTFMKAFEKRDLERQVRELQVVVKKLKKKGA